MSSAPANRPVTPPLIQRSAAGLGFLEGGTGRPLLLLHGIPGSSAAWAAVGERLTSRARVIIPDLAGFGRSRRPARDGYMEEQARSVRRLLERLGITDLVLGGHDFGGPVALTLVRLFPELRVRALILSATNLFTDTPIPPPLRLAGVPVLGPVLFRLMAGNRLGLRLMYAAACARKSNLPWSRFRAHLTPSAMDMTWRIFHRSLSDLEANYGAIEAGLTGLRMPTLVLWGDRDPFFPGPVGERSARAIRGSDYHVLAGTGHFVPEEQPDLVADAIASLLPALPVPPGRGRSPAPRPEAYPVEG